MSGCVVRPLEYLNADGPLIFLAGPIQGGPDWQGQAIEIIHELAPELNIASPRVETDEWKYLFEKQVDWESYHLKRAAINGVILFWLAKEIEHDCGRAYAQTTRYELGKWSQKRARIVVGVEVVEAKDGFSGAQYIRYILLQDRPDILFFSSLEETCLKAVEFINH